MPSIKPKKIIFTGQSKITLALVNVVNWLLDNGGSGGSGITPNPSGTATDNLVKAEIDGTIYAIQDSDAVHTADVGTAAAKDVPASGDASSTEVVMGNDSRLTDARNAADVYAWAKAATKPSYTASEVGAIPSTDKGANNGVASLDSSGKVPSSQLPSYVDDVVEGYYDSTTDRFYEESTFETVIPPVDGKSWVDVSTNKSYRWTGSVYTRVDEGVQLGTTHSTAAYGDEGATAYAHATESGKISTAVASGLYKIAATAEGHVAGLTQVQKNDLTALGVADASDLDDKADNVSVNAKVPSGYGAYGIPKFSQYTGISTDLENLPDVVDDISEALYDSINAHGDLFSSISAQSKGTYYNQTYDSSLHEFDAITVETDKTSVYMAGDINTKLSTAINDHADLIGKLRVEKTLAEFNALTPAEQDDPEIVYYIPDKPSLGYPVQDDGTATDLTDGALATGRTIENWENSKHGYVDGSVGSGAGWTLFKQGSLRVLNLMNYSGATGSITIPVGHRPKSDNNTRESQIEGLGWSQTNKITVSVAVNAASGSVGCINVSTGGVIAFANVRATVVWSVD